MPQILFYYSDIMFFGLWIHIICHFEILREFLGKKNYFKIINLKIIKISIIVTVIIKLAIYNASGCTESSKNC